MFLWSYLKYLKKIYLKFQILMKKEQKRQFLIQVKNILLRFCRTLAALFAFYPRQFDIRGSMTGFLVILLLLKKLSQKVMYN